ncbi:chmp1 (chromatin modifying protein) (charged multivesicular body protein), putative [Schistosoma mansoni]|uniref:chmp1 (chromatin modifying protein) (charged multivesicular body protein), putative n=1 Tax=Schistosoma mansoni TaxID=6183 RepID=UPI00022C8182|nr:chmp1 (chromatin modifying protein) (charged multivesicular body protein), putative [Schistosoma mansoni]|eukprot:XP_018644257.1 chmp1 (chromatin modifying protein) (charged multivesicular body protein), putative [Schistosoma mansoni]
MFGNRTDKLQDSLIQLRIAAKQVMRFSEKAARESEVQKQKLKKALTSGNIECGRIYAENAIRKQKESTNYLRMASRFDAVQSRVQTALTMNQVVKNIGAVSNELEKAMRTMDLEKLEKVMSKFESQFEDLDIRSLTMENSMRNIFTLSAPEDEINSLIKQASLNQLWQKKTVLKFHTLLQMLLLLVVHFPLIQSHLGMLKMTLLQEGLLHSVNKTCQPQCFVASSGQ